MRKIIVIALLVLLPSLVNSDDSALKDGVPKDRVQDEIVLDEIVQKDVCTYRLTLATKASQKTIWKLWADVDNWKDYDTILEYSYLKDDVEFAVGAIGYVKADGAPKTKFEIIAVDHGNSFVESLKLPLWSTLELKRYVAKNDNDEIIFTHEVEFKGLMKHVYYFLLAKTFKKELYLVMGRMKVLAESREDDSDKSSLQR